MPRRWSPTNVYQLSAVHGLMNVAIGGGLWHPEAAPVAAMRRAIDRHPQRLKAVLQDPRIRKEFLKGAAASEKAVVRAFCEGNSENALKKKPKVSEQSPIPSLHFTSARSPGLIALSRPVETCSHVAQFCVWRREASVGKIRARSLSRCSTTCHKLASVDVVAEVEPVFVLESRLASI